MPRFARNGELDLEKILGKLLNHDGNVVMMRNIRTRKPMKSAVSVYCSSEKYADIDPLLIAPL
jgi:hypothetical protein